ncbi:MAG: radical SAM protein [Rhodoferax sp.]
MAPVVVRNLEVHLAHACNLACESCSHYSNFKHSGVLALDDFEASLQHWHTRIEPQQFSLLGGEPTIHPQLPDFLYMARKYWPRSQLRLVTNGFFLHRHPELPKAIASVKNAALYLSLHHASPEYQAKLQPVFDLLKEWIRDHGIKVHIYHSYKNWTRRYESANGTFEPYKDKAQRKSWEICPAKYCPQLFEGKIWKCAPLAYLEMQSNKLSLSSSWDAYRKYQPLTPECSDAELAAFFQKEDEPFCTMCPSKVIPLQLRAPFHTGNKSLADTALD